MFSQILKPLNSYFSDSLLFGILLLLNKRKLKQNFSFLKEKSVHFFSDNNNFNNHFSSFVSSSSGDPSKEKEEAEEVKELAAQSNFNVHDTFT